MGELARLPELTAEELDVLADALKDLALKLVGEGHTAPGHFAVMARWEGQTVMSLLTAVREARLSLERGAMGWDVQDPPGVDGGPRSDVQDGREARDRSPLGAPSPGDAAESD